ncbi:anion exchanger family protein [Klebsormidium nitens]|uniref:Anion exchanger family protein n=1 Tax=Klebsormidium nitens TaxID=105231 RepID=A0A1Y1IGD3_KLENI|nr:anion exchanger family protein [Klebsormidium nitens]|eukprot:GAQ87198.1 anion exchanger family protein [Klebsormidium nitens]
MLHQVKRGPFTISADVSNRLPWYADDWREGLNCGLRILAPATYIFFASAIPALAFGEQLERATDGTLSAVHTLAATGITGVLQAVFGGQPLLIVGVSEPITLIYSYMYSFSKSIDAIGPGLFLAWAGWACIWAALFIAILALSGACQLIGYFTRFSGELFGMLIAILFMQEAIKGWIEEFGRQKGPTAAVGAAQLPEWRLVNGLWGLVLGFGLLFTSMVLRTARGWRFGPAWIRGFLADYGVPIMVAVWSALSFAVKGAPTGVLRRLALPNTWNVKDTWTVAKDLGNLDGAYVAAAIIPGFIIAVLFYFDHNVSSQMAQQEDFNLKKPAAYNYDMLLLAFLTLLCGLIGLPPINGVLPQAPMHTKSLATLKRQINRAALRKRAVRAVDSDGPSETDAEREAKVMETHIPVEVKEQRVTPLLQSALVLACLAITPALRQIPTSVLWGFFAYMALESLPGSQFWDRCLWSFTSRPHRMRLLQKEHPPYLEVVPFRTIVAFTLFQVVYTAAVYGITWIPIAGILFPIPIMLLVPARRFLLPRFFSPGDLRELDAAQYEEAPPLPPELVEERVDGGRQSLDKSAADDDEVQSAEWPGLEIKHHLTQAAMHERGLLHRQRLSENPDRDLRTTRSF